MSPGSYVGILSVSGKSVEIHGEGATLNGTSGMDAIDVFDGAYVRILGLTAIVSGTSGSWALDCDTRSTNAATPTVELENVTLSSASSALHGQPCNATIKRSHLISITQTDPNVFFFNASSLTAEQTLFEGGDGVWVDGANASGRITNSVFKNMGSNGAFRGSDVLGLGAGSMFVSFSTVINSSVKCGSTPPQCAGGTDVGSCIDNTIIFNGNGGAPADTMYGGCKLNYSIVYPQTTFQGGTSNQLGVNPMLKNAAAGDYHLTPGSPAVNAADPASTLSIDYDGAARPQGAGRDIGAFELAP